MPPIRVNMSLTIPTGTPPGVLAWAFEDVRLEPTSELLGMPDVADCPAPLVASAVNDEDVLVHVWTLPELDSPRTPPVAEAIAWPVLTPPPRLGSGMETATLAVAPAALLGLESPVVVLTPIRIA